MIKKSDGLLGFFLLCAISGPCSLALAETTPEGVGVAAAVNPTVEGTPPALPTRIVQIGADLVRNEALRTGPDGQLQVLFRDGSTLSMGPNGSLVIDEFVYDAGTRKAHLVLSLSVGLLRFVGGRATKSDDGVTIHTPSAAVGLRGGIALVDVDGRSGATEATLVYGRSLTLTSGDQIERVTRPGLRISAVGSDAAAWSVVKASRDDVEAAIARLEGRPGRNGGATAEIPPLAKALTVDRQSQNADESFDNIVSRIRNDGAIQAISSIQSRSDWTQDVRDKLRETVYSFKDAPICKTCRDFTIEGVISNSVSFEFSLDGKLVFSDATPAPESNVLISRIGWYAPNFWAPYFNGTSESLGFFGPSTVTSATSGGIVSVNSYADQHIKDIKLLVFSDLNQSGNGYYRNVGSYTEGNLSFSKGIVAETVGDEIMSSQRIQNVVVTGTEKLLLSGVGNDGIFYPSQSAVADYQLTASGNQSIYTLTNIPARNPLTSGTYSYSLLGATTPTYGDGIGTPGTFAATLTVQFGKDWRLANLSVTVTMPGEGAFTFQAGYKSFGVIDWDNPDVTAIGSSRVCPAPLDCQAFTKQIYAGEGFTHFGLTYAIGLLSSFDATIPGTNASDMIVGSAVFKRN